ncbi:MAG: Bax inhibitor-1/YccA family protein [Peptostreptococcaceae bacterium]|jgi:FtsH-binding integral membrane protein|nr:Bax inhibitor-1/YccA family protein [Peptostreptococcaceae bacterium]
MEHNSYLSQEQIEDIQINFINKVFGYMSLALLITALFAFIVSNSPLLLYAIYSNKIVFFGLIIGEFFMVRHLSKNVYKMNSTKAFTMFVLYSILNGITLSYIFKLYTSSSIVSTFLVASVTFLTMSFIGFKTQSDLTKFSKLFSMALMGIIIASLANFLLQSSAVTYVVTYFGLFLFIGLVAYDTQKLKYLSIASYEDESLSGNLAIIGALSLYLDFINIFLFLLRIFGDRD